jgi:hypothetical protein
VRNSSDISKGIFALGICEFESSQVSQPVTQLEIVSIFRSKTPYLIGFLRINNKSIVSDKGQLWREFVESLQARPHQFPFLGDFEQRQFSIPLDGVGGSLSERFLRAVERLLSEIKQTCCQRTAMSAFDPQQT